MASAAAGPKLFAPTAPVEPGSAVVVSLSVPSLVLIDGCSPMEFERKEAEGWRAVAIASCDAAPVATRVDRELTLSAPAPAAGEYRVVVGWGANCAESMPFVLSGCRKLGLVRSESFVVGTVGAPKSENPPATTGGAPASAGAPPPAPGPMPPADPGTPAAP